MRATRTHARFGFTYCPYPLTKSKTTLYTISIATLYSNSIDTLYTKTLFMPKISEDIIRAVLDRARIEDVVGEFVTLRKAGVNMTGICPFHDDQHSGNFIVYPKKNCYRCFACEAKGGAIDFLMKHEKLSYADAIRWLGKKYGIDTDMKDFKLHSTAATTTTGTTAYVGIAERYGDEPNEYRR